MPSILETTKLRSTYYIQHTRIKQSINFSKKAFYRHIVVRKSCTRDLFFAYLMPLKYPEFCNPFCSFNSVLGILWQGGANGRNTEESCTKFYEVQLTIAVTVIKDAFYRKFNSDSEHLEWTS